MISALYGSSHSRRPSFQSADEVYLPTISPNPEAIMARGAARSVLRSAKMASGAWV
jgi:hypothetical protein